MTSPLAACPLGIDDETLSAWRDHLLSPARMQQIAAHVPECPACQRRLATFARIASDLAQRPRLTPGNRIVNGVLAHIAAEEQSPMAHTKRSWQRGIGALGVVALIAAFAVIFTLVLHGRPATSISRSTSNATSTTSTTPTYTPIVSITQAWGANAGTTVTPQTPSQKYFLSGDISADGSKIFGDTVTNPPPMSGGVTSYPGTYTIATKQFTPYAIPTEKNTMGPSTGCCQASASFAIITQNTEPGATCGICHTIYYSVDLASGEIRLLTDPNARNEQGIMGLTLSQDHALAQTGAGGYRLVDLHSGTFSDPLGPPMSLTDSLIDFSWPYLIYDTNGATYSINGPSQVTARDLRTGAETVIHAPTGNSAAFARPFSTHPGTPLPSPTPPLAFTGILGGAITGDTFFFVSQTPAATYLDEIDHLMAPGAPAKVIATLPNHHDGTQFAVGLASDRLVVIVTSQQHSDFTYSGQNLAFDRIQHRFVDMFEDNQTNGYADFSLTGEELMLTLIPSNVTMNSSPTDIIYNIATLPTT
jgi:hypothetical protein